MALGMNKREKYAVLIAGVLVFLTAVYTFGISPVVEQNKLLKRQLDAKKKVLDQISQLSREYNEILSKNENLGTLYASREEGFTLFAFLEKIAAKAGVDKQIDYMKPSSAIDKFSETELSLVEMKLKGIKLSQLMSYLYLVETSRNIVFVKRLSITHDGKNQNTISAVLQVETVKS